MLGIDLQEAKSRLLNAMQPKEGPSEEAASEEPVAEEAELHEAQEENVNESAADETIDEPIEGSEPETAIVGDVEEEPELYKVKVQGEELEVTLEDLRSGYMMGADYTKKSQDLSAQREEISNKQQELALKLEDAQALLKIEMEDFDSDDMKELKEYDPERFYEKKELLEGKVKRFNELKEEVQKHQRETYQQQLQREGELLLQAIPEWLDQSVAQREVDMINKYWSDIGLTEQDINSPALQDHRLIKISRDAARYAALQTSKPATKKVPPKTKSTKPASANDIQVSKNTAQQQRYNRVKKTGNMKDAQAAIKDILNKRK